MAPSSALATYLETRIAKLDRMFDRIVSCHVVVELDGHHHRHGDRFRISINIGLPGHELLVTHVPTDGDDGTNAYASADRAFDDAERQLRDWGKSAREHRHETTFPNVAGRPAN